MITKIGFVIGNGMLFSQSNSEKKIKFIQVSLRQ